MKTVRDGQKVWPYCEECGCRLHISQTQELLEANDVMLVHYGWQFETDPRGHKCSLVNQTYFLPIAHVTEFEIIDIGM